MKRHVLFIVLVLFSQKTCHAQVLLFGECVEVETMKYFDLEKFLGKWYEIERFPTWYEEYSACAYKRVQACGRRIEIEHVFVKDNIEFVLHVNSTYTPGDEAIFAIQENNIDPVGIPISVLTTDYNNYAVLYGCKHDLEMDIKYISAWILSRESTLHDDYKQQAYTVLNSIPYASTVYLQTVEQREEKCLHHWTAHVQAENINEETSRK